MLHLCMYVYSICMSISLACSVALTDWMRCHSIRLGRGSVIKDNIFLNSEWNKDYIVFFFLRHLLLYSNNTRTYMYSHVLLFNFFVFFNFFVISTIDTFYVPNFKALAWLRVPKIYVEQSSVSIITPKNTRLREKKRYLYTLKIYFSIFSIILVSFTLKTIYIPNSTIFSIFLFYFYFCFTSIGSTLDWSHLKNFNLNNVWIFQIT